jgi:hypothetical protein
LFNDLFKVREVQKEDYFLEFGTLQIIPKDTLKKYQLFQLFFTVSLFNTVEKTKTRLMVKLTFRLFENALFQGNLARKIFILVSLNV